MKSKLHQKIDFEREKKLALTQLFELSEEHPRFRIELADFLGLTSTVAVDQWMMRRSIPITRLPKFWEFVGVFSLRKTKGRKKKTG